MTTVTSDIALSLLSDQREERGRLVTVERGVMALNDGVAAGLRVRFATAGVLTVIVLSSPGSGKTTLLARTLAQLAAFHPAVIVGDLATDHDAERLRESGAAAVQIQTGNLCHLEASMVARAVDSVGLQGRRLLLIENVGNLVCPASYDLGEALRVVLVSTTEGEDKPLKYPRAFKGAQAVVITKMDLAGVAGTDLALLGRNIQAVCPGVPMFPVSARTGTGLAAWCAFLTTHLSPLRATPHPPALNAEGG